MASPFHMIEIKGALIHRVHWVITHANTTNSFNAADQLALQALATSLKSADQSSSGRAQLTLAELRLVGIACRAFKPTDFTDEAYLLEVLELVAREQQQQQHP